MKIRNVEVPDYIICWEEYVAMREAEQEKKSLHSKEWDYYPGFRDMEEFYLRNLIENKSKEIDKLLKKYSIFDLNRKKKAENDFEKMRKKSEDRIREDDRKYRDRWIAFDKANEKYKQAVEEFNQKESDAFCEKMLTNSDFQWAGKRIASAIASRSRTYISIREPSPYGGVVYVSYASVPITSKSWDDLSASICFDSYNWIDNGDWLEHKGAWVQALKIVVEKYMQLYHPSCQAHWKHRISGVFDVYLSDVKEP